MIRIKEQGRPWLKVEEKDGVMMMFWDLCRRNDYGMANTTCAFAKSTTSVRLDGITQHEASGKHKRERAAEEVAKCLPGESTAERILKKMNKTQCKLFKNTDNHKFWRTTKNCNLVVCGTTTFFPIIWMLL